MQIYNDILRNKLGINQRRGKAYQSAVDDENVYKS